MGDSSRASLREPQATGDVRIFVVQGGWVFVGYFTRDSEGVVITSAKNIRRWGTTNGLGELCSGPARETKLDKAGTVRLHPLQIICTFDASTAGWVDALHG